MPFCIGLTGGIGSGKSTVADMFRKRGAGVIDTDVIAHALTQAGADGYHAICATFGTSYLRPDGSLDRAKLRALVFSDPAAKARLEAILHPMIRAQVERAIIDAVEAYLILVVPLLFETGSYDALIQRTLVVDCSEGEQIARTTARSGLDAAEVRAIMGAQVDRGIRLAKADDVIHNSGSLGDLERQVEQLDQCYRMLAAGRSSGT
jgi:dephospho-CoA kinase